MRSGGGIRKVEAKQKAKLSQSEVAMKRRGGAGGGGGGRGEEEGGGYEME